MGGKRFIARIASIRQCPDHSELDMVL